MTTPTVHKTSEGTIYSTRPDGSIIVIKVEDPIDLVEEPLLADSSASTNSRYLHIPTVEFSLTFMGRAAASTLEHARTACRSLYRTGVTWTRGQEKAREKAVRELLKVDEEYCRKEREWNEGKG